ncbi:MAG: hypothetical protein AABX88_00950 [Nanoarchaeota archaeon]
MHLGKIIDERENSYEILRYEKDISEFWKKSYVEPFKTIQEALAFQKKYNGRRSTRLMEIAQENFPSEFK